jgi:hypothetical protein
MNAAQFKRFGWAAGSAVVACVAACSLPLLAAGVGSGAAAAALARVLRPGAEFVVGGATFALVLGALTARVWRRRSRALSAGEHCPVVGCGCSAGAQHELKKA